MNKKRVTGNGKRVMGFLRIPYPPPLLQQRTGVSHIPNKGLTLIEVMVVVAILAIISSTLFSIFHGSLLSQRRGTNKALIYSEARAALDMMSREIENAIVDERIPLYCEGIDGGIGSDTFLFFAPLNPDSSSSPYRGDLCEVGYWLGVPGSGSDTDLVRGWTTGAINFDLSDFGFQNALISSVHDLQFNYFDGQYWTPDGWWGPNITLPYAVRITLVLEYEIEREDIRHDTFITVVNIPGSGQ